MFFSKIWFVLLAVLAAVACGVALVASKPAVREVNKAKAFRLDTIQHNTELVLKLTARQWIDAAAGMSRDRTLVETLERATDRKGDLDPLKQKAVGRLLSLTSGLKADRRPELMIITDAKGKQLARIGPGEEKYEPGKVGLAGYPVVEAALRGYRRDDTWEIDGKLYMMVGSPVISRGRGRYVGALLLGRQLGDVFARHLKGRLGGTDIVFFLRGSILASTFKSADLNNLPIKYSAQREQILKDGRSTATQIGEGERTQLVIMAPFLGEARDHDAFYVVVGSPVPPLGLGTLKDQITGSDIAWGNFPWLLFVGGLVVVLLVGLGLMIWEVDLPANRLLDRLTELAKGEASRLNDRQFSGKYGSMARSVNGALDRAEKRSPASSTKDLNKILGSPAEQGTRPELRMDPSFSSMPPLASTPGVKRLEDIGADGKSSAAKALEVEVVPTKANKEAPFQQLGALIGPTVDLDPEEAPTELQTDPPEFAPRKAPESGKPPSPPVSVVSEEPTPAVPSAVETLEPLSSRAARSFGLEPSLMPAAAEEPEEGPSKREIKIPESEQISLPPAQSLPPLGSDKGQEKKKAQEAETAQSKSTAEALPTVPPEALREPEKPDEAEEEDQEELGEYFQQIYNSFISVKQQCGENIENLTFERFEAKLKQNRLNLIKRYACKSVKFQVYIKDGKAAIKATPIKE